MKSNENVRGRGVLVTGCSSGIGRATVRVLRDAGWAVVPSARKEEDLASLRSDGFDPVRLDVGDPESVESAVGDVLARHPMLYAVVNNAGYGQPGALEEISRDQLRRQFEVNVLGLHDLTVRLLPAMREAGSGRVVHISSVVGRQVLPFLGAYCASKHAVEALGDAMRIELAGSGIRVVLIEPGPIETGFRARAESEAKEAVKNEASPYRDGYRRYFSYWNSDSPRLAGWFSLPPEAVGRAVARALAARHPWARYPVTLPAHVGGWMRRLLPTFIDDAVKGWAIRGGG